MKFICATIFSILLFISCNSRNQSLGLKIKSVYGLSNNSTVIFNETEIGKFKIVANQSYAEILIESNDFELLKIPIDSKLQISEYGELQNVKTKLILGKSNVFLKTGDTLSWFISDEEKQLEKTLMVGDFLFVSQKDSLKNLKDK